MLSHDDKGSSIVIMLSPAQWCSGAVVCSCCQSVFTCHLPQVGFHPVGGGGGGGGVGTEGKLSLLRS